MSMLGMGAMLAMLGGNRESAEAFSAAVGKTIETLELDTEKQRLVFRFTDGTSIALYDDAQSCCESRYMTTDDDLAPFIGATLLGAEVCEGPGLPAEYDEHETAFLIVTTSLGAFTMCTHNEHNGYYGGFAVRAVAL